MKSLTVLFILITNYSLAGNLDLEVKKQIDSLKNRGIEKVFFHQYSLFTGRYEILYDNVELRCDKIPTVVHIFWFENEGWRCLRLDHCGLFEKVNIAKIDFDKIVIDEAIEFKTPSPHFSRYTLTKFYKDNNTSVTLSGSQIRHDKNRTIKTFKKINKLIRKLEDSHQFKRLR